MSEPRLTAAQKESIAERAGFCCEYCYSQLRFSPDPFSIEHIWNDDYSQILGLIPIGRATVERLQLNRNGVVNLRRVLYSVREHPPVHTT